MNELHLTKSDIRICLALGFFDSVHIGHRQIIERVIGEANARGVASAVMTFDNNPLNLLGNNDMLVYTYAERMSILERLGVDYVLPMTFDEKFRSMQPKAFFRRIVDCFDVKMLACGYDFRFGRNGRGDTDLLAKFCAKKSIELFVQNPVAQEGVRVSTTLVKTLLQSGNIQRANELLGEPWHLFGVVIQGHGVGKDIGTPTANIRTDCQKVLIGDGVYGTLARIGGRYFRSVTSVGTRPTFDDNEHSVETHLLDFDEDIYGQEIMLTFVKKLREIEDFGSVDALKAQLETDKKWT